MPQREGVEVITVVAAGGWKKILGEDKTGHIYISKRGKICVYDQNGIFQKNLSFTKYLKDFWVCADGYIWCKFFTEFRP